MYNSPFHWIFDMERGFCTNVPERTDKKELDREIKMTPWEYIHANRTFDIIIRIFTWISGVFVWIDNIFGSIPWKHACTMQAEI